MKRTSMSKAEAALELLDASWQFLMDAREPKHQSGEITVTGPNTGAGQDFKGAGEQKGAQAKTLHWVQQTTMPPTWECQGAL